MHVPTSLRYLLVTFLFLSLAGASGVLAQGPASPILLETQKMVASEGSAGDELNRIAVDGNVAVFGAPGARDEGFQAGKAYISEYIGGDWVQKQILLPAEIEAGDSFGNVVAIGGGSIFIFAGDDGPAGIDQGAVYRYALENGIWVQKSTLFAPDAFQRDQFGGSLSTDGHWLAIGAPGDDDAGTDMGTVYIYEKSGTSWLFRHKIVPSGLGSLEQFGSNTSIKDSHLVVSSLGTSRVFVYSLNTGTGEFVIQQELMTVDGGVPTGKVAVDGSTALVGAAGRFNPGAVYVFKHDGTQWSQAERLTASDGGDPSFGTSLALDKNVAVVGAVNTSLGNAARGGQAYLLKRPNSEADFTETNRLQASDTQSFDFFARNVAVDEGHVLIGSSADQMGDGAGAIYYFGVAIVDTDGDGWRDDLDNCPFVPNQDQLNTDQDDVGDVCDADDDNDGEADLTDNCPIDANSLQEDNEGDDRGDVCDPDDDDDSLLDEWEIRGLTINGSGSLAACTPSDFCALPLFNALFRADPLRKDVFVEIDYMACTQGGCDEGDSHTHRLDEDQIALMESAFAIAPVDNGKGVALHLHVSEALRHHDLIAFDDEDRVLGGLSFDDIKLRAQVEGSACSGHLGNPAERQNVETCTQVIDARKQVFHYALLGHHERTRRYFNLRDGLAYITGGEAEGPGNDLLLYLGDLDLDDRRPSTRKLQVQAGTFMHELGHNLGLCHGGPLRDTAGRCNDLPVGHQLNVNHKPNYLSIMNYALAIRDNATSRPLDYSRWALPPLGNSVLLESALVESAGIDGGTPPSDLNRWPETAFTYRSTNGKCRIDSAPTIGPIDWNHNGSPDLGTLPEGYGINDPEDCDTSTAQELQSFEDWHSLIYAFQNTRNFADGARLTIPEEEDFADPVVRAGMRDGDGDEVTDDIDNCPRIANGDQVDSDDDGQGDACDAAPIVTSVTTIKDPIPTGTAIEATATYSDSDDGDRHSARWNWGDGVETSGIVDNDHNTIAGSHTYSAAGVYTVQVTVTDSDQDGVDNIGSRKLQFVVVYNPSAGFVTGGGWIDSPAGAYTINPVLTGVASFGFVSKYAKGANVPDGNTEFQFKAGAINFRSSSYDWLVVSGQSKAKYKGTGTLNGRGSYGFMITAVDNGSNGDTFRIKIWDKDNENIVVYDNAKGTGDDAYDGTVISGGNIKVHSK